MTQPNNLDVTKKLSLQSKHLLDELGNISTKAADLIPRLYKSLKDDGLQPSEIRKFIENRISISQRRLRELLPLEAKNQSMLRRKPPQNQEPELEFVVDKVDEYIANVPKQSEPEPPKTIPTADRKVILDTGKFRSDLRIALINGDKIWLHYNNANEIISINPV